jgi:hypothetical protein
MGCSASEKEDREKQVEAGRGTRNRDARDRKKIESILDGAEPWKENEVRGKKFMTAFINWQHENPTKGGIDGFVEAMGLAQLDEMAIPQRKHLMSSRRLRALKNECQRDLKA